MFPTLNNLTSGKKRRIIWQCDFCKGARFDNYDECVAHESTCALALRAKCGASAPDDTTAGEDDEGQRAARRTLNNARQAAAASQRPQSTVKEQTIVETTEGKDGQINSILLNNILVNERLPAPQVTEASDDEQQRPVEGQQPAPKKPRLMETTEDEDGQPNYLKPMEATESKDGHPNSSLTDEEVRGLFDLWNDALASGDPQRVAGRYTKDAVLRCGPDPARPVTYTGNRIAGYFRAFLAEGPVGKILEGVVESKPGWAQDAGTYGFTFPDGSKVLGRYYFAYAHEDGEWKISIHHSSLFPVPWAADPTGQSKLGKQKLKRTAESNRGQPQCGDNDVMVMKNIVAQCTESSRGLWAALEDAELERVVLLHGPRKTAAWTVEENRIILQHHQNYGNCWSDMAKLLPGRSDNAVKEHFIGSMKKKIERYISSRQGGEVCYLGDGRFWFGEELEGVLEAVCYTIRTKGRKTPAQVGVRISPLRKEKLATNPEKRQSCESAKKDHLIVPMESSPLTFKAEPATKSFSTDEAIEEACGNETNKTKDTPCAKNNEMHLEPINLALAVSDANPASADFDETHAQIDAFLDDCLANENSNSGVTK